MVAGGVVQLSDEELLAAIADGPGFLPEFYRRHVAKVTGVGVRRFRTPEDVADFVANVFLEVMESAGSYGSRRGNAVAWLYGLAGNVAAGMCRQQQRVVDAERRMAGRALLDSDDYVRVEERIDAPQRCVGPMRLCSSCRTGTGGCWSWSLWMGAARVRPPRCWGSRRSRPGCAWFVPDPGCVPCCRG
jgi:Sigma-70 region 2